MCAQKRLSVHVSSMRAHECEMRVRVMCVHGRVCRHVWGQACTQAFMYFVHVEACMDVVYRGAFKCACVCAPTSVPVNITQVCMCAREHHRHSCRDLGTCGQSTGSTWALCTIQT